ncbi:hypothetical protein WI23_23660 [Burkholderia oklahomensis C6786]|nr:hypothetical protein WI23_23660 [Burkholderia oklahomensis C6786]KUY50575.1 hypothetical protein WI23_27585 [Burkholderia oklahomensis C6786]
MSGRASFAVHRSLFIVRCSSFIVRRSSFAVRCNALQCNALRWRRGKRAADVGSRGRRHRGGPPRRTRHYPGDAQPTGNHVEARA